MKHKILNNIIDDIKKLEQIIIIDTIDEQILNDLLKQIHLMQKTADVTNGKNQINKI